VVAGDGADGSGRHQVAWTGAARRGIDGRRIVLAGEYAVRLAGADDEVGANALHGHQSPPVQVGAGLEGPGGLLDHRERAGQVTDGVQGFGVKDLQVDAGRHVDLPALLA
jgi:hypothetical protein